MGFPLGRTTTSIMPKKDFQDYSSFFFVNFVLRVGIRKHAGKVCGFFRRACRNVLNYEQEAYLFRHVRGMNAGRTYKVQQTSAWPTQKTVGQSATDMDVHQTWAYVCHTRP